MKLSRYLRLLVLLFGGLLSLLFYLWVKITVPTGIIQTIKLTQLYGLTALTYLYCTLLASPLTKFFINLPGRGYYLHARRSLGQSVFYFAVLHSTITFWGQLGGFTGLGFLNGKYLFAISLSFTALLILAGMTATSFDYMVRALGHKNWKRLHRCVYLAGILIILHALLLGTHFSDFSRLIPQIFLVAMAGLLLLEAIRFDNYLQTKRSDQPHYAATFATVLLITSVILYTLINHHLPSPLNIHKHFSQVLIQSVEAHVLEADNTVGAVLHISPTDDPSAGQVSYFFFDFKDKEGNFTLTTCDCRLVITRGGQELYSQPLTDKPSFTFPTTDVYQIQVIGHPRESESFAPFTLHYDVRVTHTTPPPSSPPNWVIRHLIHFAGAGIITFTFLAMLIYEKVKRR